MNAYLLASAVLTPKSNIPDEYLPTDFSALEQQREVGDPPAMARQP
jgi:hypothetical protein